MAQKQKGVADAVIKALFPTVSQDAECEGPMQCSERLGGLLKYYTREAA